VMKPFAAVGVSLVPGRGTVGVVVVVVVIAVAGGVVVDVGDGVGVDVGFGADAGVLDLGVTSLNF